ncbi:glycosyltransferase [Candidatus Pelagibacter sp. HIMB1517]|uniref:glycosyltransferase n=1 Tax=Candidatus Pelagibacter sp. HIMB1517 TaxID=3413341 RepID=UPI003F839546
MKTLKIFTRKPRDNLNFSVERIVKVFVKEYQKIDQNKKVIEIQALFVSSGIFKRIIIILSSLFRGGDINLIFGDINFISLVLNKRKTFTVILDLYLLEKFTGMKYFFYKLFWITIPIYRSRKIILISKAIFQELTKLYPDFSQKFEYISCPLPILKKNFSIKKKRKFTILFLGTSENKNLKNAILAIKGLNVKIIIVGLIEKKYMNLLKKFNINFENFINIKDDQISELYSLSDLLLFISTYEGFGLPIIEANYLSIPVITSNKSPMREVANNSAVLVNPYNINQIKNKILMIMRNKKLRNELIFKGRINSRKYFSENIFKKYKKIFN